MQIETKCFGSSSRNLIGLYLRKAHLDTKSVQCFRVAYFTQPSLNYTDILIRVTRGVKRDIKLTLIQLIWDI